jgi:hypothetical protein
MVSRMKKVRETLAEIGDMQGTREEYFPRRL